MSCKDAVIWTGPINLSFVPDATIPGDPLRAAFPCTGDGYGGSALCADMAAGLQAEGGSVVAGMLHTMGTSLEQVGDVLVGAFSAGGSTVARMLHTSDRRRVRVFHLADATYTSGWKDKANRIPAIGENFVQFLIEVATGPGDQLVICTASPNPNGQWASGVENLREYRAEIQRRTGLTFEPLGDFYGIVPAPDAAYRLGNVILAEYPAEPLGHNHPKIAGQVWGNIITPWLMEYRAAHGAPCGAAPEPVPGPGPGPIPGPGAEPMASSGRALLDFAVLAAGAALGYATVRVATRK